MKKEIRFIIELAGRVIGVKKTNAAVESFIKDHPEYRNATVRLGVITS